MHVSHKEKDWFAEMLKEIWRTSDINTARERARQLGEEYGKRFPKAIEVLKDGLEDSLAYLASSKLNSRKVSSLNMLERLNREIRRGMRIVGIFPHPDS